MSITVLVVDDTEVIRKAIRNLLKQDPQIRVVGETASYTDTMQITGELKPQVIVMDMHMPDGTTVTSQQIKSLLSASGSRLVATSVWNDQDTKVLADSFGAVRLLDKLSLYAELIPAIKQCAKGYQGTDSRHGDVLKAN
jgi:two-component system, NarL family, response regulator DevR